MRHANLLAASVTAATFVVLALLPLTREALRFDMKMAAGQRVMGSTLTDLGVRQDDLPFSNILPPSPARRDNGPAKSSEFSVQLANAMYLPGREKWAALQQLTVQFPNEPAAHTALARIACKNGGSVDVGHNLEQAELARNSGPVRAVPNPSDPNDIAVMLRSCDIGERIDPENAYFPAMAVIAHLAAGHDSAAQDALHRAAGKPYWREYIEVEARGRVRRAELLNGPQNSLTECATMASILFPHYAALRGMARVVTAQAMYREQAGDIPGGLALRRDVARIGAKMRQQSSSLIGGLVGMAMIRVTELRPGGAPLLQRSDSYNDETGRDETDARFLAYLAAHGTKEDAALWNAYVAAERETRALASQATSVSAFGIMLVFESQWSLLASMSLLGAVILLSALGGIALLRPWLDYRVGRAASVLAIIGFIALLSWGTWQTLNNVRDLNAFTNIAQGLSSDGGPEHPSAPLPESIRAEGEAQARAIQINVAISWAAFLLPLAYLGVAAILAKRQRLPLHATLQRGTLPLAALVTLIYAAHLTTYSQRERVVRAELQEVITHEGRHIAAKLGKTWPVIEE